MNWRSLLVLLRPHQWSKNVLLFVPIALHHQILDAHALAAGVAAAVAFSLASSSGYVVNDLLDIESDRRHPQKRYRPLAAGGVTVPVAWLTACILGLGSAASYWLSPSLAVTILIYWLMSISYSLIFKKLLIVDVVMLASFYIIRIIAGGLAIGITLSIWTLTFSMFLFFSLAMAKRYTELRRVDRSGTGVVVPGRAYLSGDLLQINVLGGTSALIAVLVIGLYVSDPAVRAMYQKPDLLWLLCPVMLGWTSRIWILAGRGELNEDPVAFALKDMWSYGAGIMMGLIVLASIYL